MTQTHYILKDKNGKIVKMTDSFPLARQGGYEQTKTTQDIVRCSGELYLNGENPKPDILEKARILRSQRNDLLAQSDWTQLPDTPLSSAERTAWAEYRQALRNLPEQSGFPNEVSFPEKIAL